MAQAASASHGWFMARRLQQAHPGKQSLAECSGEGRFPYGNVTPCPGQCQKAGRTGAPACSLLEPATARRPVQRKRQAGTRKSSNGDLNLHGNLWEDGKGRSHSRLGAKSDFMILWPMSPCLSPCHPHPFPPLSCQRKLPPAGRLRLCLLPSSLADVDLTLPPTPRLLRAMPVRAVSTSLDPAKQNRAGKDGPLLPTQGSEGSEQALQRPPIGCEAPLLCCFIFPRVFRVREAASQNASKITQAQL